MSSTRSISPTLRRTNTPGDLEFVESRPLEDSKDDERVKLQHPTDEKAPLRTTAEYTQSSLLPPLRPVSSHISGIENSPLKQPHTGGIQPEPSRPDPMMLSERPWRFPTKGENKTKKFDSRLDEGKTAYVNKWANAIEVPSNQDFTSSFAQPKQGVTVRVLPTGLAAVTIKDTNSPRELGVFANMDLPSRHKVIVEEPIISAIHWRQRKGLRTIGQEWLKLKPRVRADLRTTFKRLSTIKSEDTMSPSDQKKLEGFMEDYAFWDGRMSNAYIYKLVSHINHACPSCANAQHWVDSQDPNTISIRLVRNVKAGEELFIHYGKTHLSFKCAVCEGRKQSKGGQGKMSDVKNMKNTVLKTLGVRKSDRRSRSEKTKSVDGTASESLGGTTIVEREDSIAR